jgi:putative ABC transport system ATP-binding protein
MALIELNKVNKKFVTDEVSTQVLFDISFSISKGEFVAIIGPSGSGKSTLLHILGFLDEASSGTYNFNGKSQSDYSSDEQARVRNQSMGFIFQSFNLLPKTTVYDNVKLPLLYSQIKESEWDGLIKKAIESVGLSHRIKHYSSQLSGGEKQRVAIARALIINPEVIFADEPTGNLDSKSGQQVMEILQTLNERDGHTIILITHETYTAEMASRIIALKDGEIASDRQVKNRRDASQGLIK